MALSGQSYPENTAVFYQPIVKWIKEYFSQLEGQKTIFDINVSYFNSSTSKVFMDILELMDEQAKKGNSITINWMHDKDDEIILEHGEEFKEDLEFVTFNIIASEE